VVDSSNSLVGTVAGSMVGLAVTPLTNGNYVVLSVNWADAQGKKGAATWGDGSGGTVGPVSSSNSLVGTGPNDFNASIAPVSVVALLNGNYLVVNVPFNNAAGALTYGSGTSGARGVLSADTSLVGATNDNLGYGAITPLLDGRVAVATPAASSYAGRVDILSGPVADTVSNATAFATNPTAKSVLLVSDIVGLLNAGTAVSLKANNDIAVSGAISSTPGSGASGALTLDAGRSVLLNANIALTNANLTVIGNEWVTAQSGVGGGVVDAQRATGAAVITQANGTSLSAGTGDISLILRSNTDSSKTNQDTGAISLQAVSGKM